MYRRGSKKRILPPLSIPFKFLITYFAGLLDQFRGSTCREVVGGEPKKKKEQTKEQEEKKRELTFSVRPPHTRHRPAEFFAGTENVID
jgi:hypothetical protein